MDVMLLVGLATLPWVGLGAFLAYGIREPRPLPEAPFGDVTAAGAGSPGEGTDPSDGDIEPSGGAMPSAEGDVLVSVIVPARNEAGRIGRCVESLVRQEGVPHEIIVVDDRSSDGTAEEAREAGAGSGVPLRILTGEPLPDGWFGKPWACRQGAAAARGRILLFTDADTVHHPRLLARCLEALEEDAADALSLLGRQELGTFAERLVQPQIFALMGIRFRRLDRVLDRSRWEEAIANGQYILVRRKAYNDLGGHEAVKDEVVEDLRLAQELTRAGRRLTIRQAEEAFATRMYTSLASLVNGWTKNMAIGARQAAGGLAPVAVPGILLFLLVAWLLPPLATVGAVGLAAAGHPAIFPGPESWASGAWGHAGLAVAVWGALTWGLCVLIWAGGYRRFGVSPAMALLYPLGTLVVAFIVCRSWLRGSRKIEWKGRVYGGARD